MTNLTFPVLDGKKLCLKHQNSKFNMLNINHSHLRKARNRVISLEKITNKLYQNELYLSPRSAMYAFLGGDS